MARTKKARAVVGAPVVVGKPGQWVDLGGEGRYVIAFDPVHRGRLMELGLPEALDARFEGDRARRALERIGEERLALVIGLRDGERPRLVAVPTGMMRPSDRAKFPWDGAHLGMLRTPSERVVIAMGDRAALEDADAGTTVAVELAEQLALVLRVDRTALAEELGSQRWAAEGDFYPTLVVSFTQTDDVSRFKTVGALLDPPERWFAHQPDLAGRSLVRALVAEGSDLTLACTRPMLAELGIRTGERFRVHTQVDSAEFVYLPAAWNSLTLETFYSLEEADVHALDVAGWAELNPERGRAAHWLSMRYTRSDLPRPCGVPFGSWVWIEKVPATPLIPPLSRADFEDGEGERGRLEGKVLRVGTRFLWLSAPASARRKASFSDRASLALTVGDRSPVELVFYKSRWDAQAATARGELAAHACPSWDESDLKFLLCGIDGRATKRLPVRPEAGEPYTLTSG